MNSTRSGKIASIRSPSHELKGLDCIRCCSSSRLVPKVSGVARLLMYCPIIDRILYLIIDVQNRSGDLRMRRQTARTIAVERKSLSVQVADKLRQLIISNTYAQGEQLRQEEVARQLGVSHIPVRAAFQLLEAEGLITNVPYKGAVVTRLSAAEIEEYFDIRATLEVDLLKRAIGKIGPEALARARKIVERMDTASPERWGEYNWKL